MTTEYWSCKECGKISFKSEVLPVTRRHFQFCHDCQTVRFHKKHKIPTKLFADIRKKHSKYRLYINNTTTDNYMALAKGYQKLDKLIRYAERQIQYARLNSSLEEEAQDIMIEIYQVLGNGYLVHIYRGPLLNFTRDKCRVC